MDALRARPSDLRTMAFCPRLLFFQVHLERRLTLKQRIRMLLGRIWHVIIEIIKVEEREIEVRGRVGPLEVVGRADGVVGDSVVEIKSGKGPRNGAWYGDYLQALAYAKVLGKGKIVVKYRDKEFVREVKDDDVKELERALELLSLILQGYLPPPKRSKWCAKCPFKDLCEELGDEWDGWFPLPPWVKA